MIIGASLLALVLSLAPQHEAVPAASPSGSPVAAEMAASPTPVAEHGEAAAPAASEAHPTEGHAEGAVAEGHEASGEEHGSPSQILMHHVTDEGAPYTFKIWDWRLFTVPISKHLFFMIVVMTLIVTMARMGVRSYKNGQPSGIGSAMEAMVLFVRDDIAEKNIGHGEGHKYTPLLLSFFVFILMAALFGLLPFSSTSTGNLTVTMALAAVSFMAQQWGGISKYGVVGH
ncbi:MAG: F0F1 ATP synthase subunit A, partial [Vicinamibacteria bacterium]